MGNSIVNQEIKVRPGMGSITALLGRQCGFSSNQKAKRIVHQNAQAPIAFLPENILYCPVSQIFRVEFRDLTMRFIKAKQFIGIILIEQVKY